MKYLDEPRLAYWSNFLRSVELGDRLLSVRTDAFSCECIELQVASEDIGGRAWLLHTQYVASNKKLGKHPHSSW